MRRTRQRSHPQSVSFFGLRAATALAGLTCLLTGACDRQPQKPAAEHVTRLIPGLVDTRSLAPGEGKLYRAALAAGEVLHLQVRQRGLDVVIDFPAGERPAIDLPYGGWVAEELWWRADQRQTLRLEVRALAGRGDYRLTVERLGPGDGVDRRRVEAFWLTRTGSSQLAARRPNEARGSLERALELWRGTDTPVGEAVAWGELARARSDSGDDEGAQDAFARALALLEPTPERTLLGRLQHRRGRALNAGWQLEAAASDYRAAKALAGESGDGYGEALATNDLAVLHDIQGELRAACDGYGRAHQLFAELGFARSAAMAQLNLGRCFMKLGALPEALATLLGALHSAEPLGAADGLRADALREIGWWHRLERQPERALVYLRRALELVPEAAGTLDRLGTVHADLGELATARRCYAQALEKVRGIALEEAHVRANLCRLEELAGRDAEGLEQCRKALPVFTRLGATGTAAQVLLLSARIERRRQRLRAAEALAERALLLIESQRPLTGDTRLRSAFLAERLDVYETLIDLRMELRAREPAAGWEARALQVSEQTRARSLLDLLSAERVDAARRVDPLQRRVEQELLARIDGRARNLAARGLAQGPPEAGAQMELAALEQQLAALRRKLRRVAPSYAALIRPQPPDIAKIQALLDRETVLVVYHLGERASYLWRVDRVGLEGYRLANRSFLERLAEAWYGLLADPGQRWAGGDPERRRARQLSARLLEPIAAELSRGRRLVIVADGALQRIPFAALPSPLESARGRPLIVDHEIVTAPSAAVLGVLRQLTAGRRAADGLLAVVADPVYGPRDDRLPNSAPVPPPVPRYRRLPSAAAEARDLLALAAGGPTLLLAGFEARRDRVMAGALEGFRIVHFATHAETQATPGRPLGLVLSRLDEGGRPIEGILGLQELYGLRLPAELVVLSACGTALGEEIRGEGLLGLSRGFMHACTPRVVVSLWAIRDRAARELMGRFYQALLRDRTGPAEALRRAQASMWRDGWPVHDWAAFVLQGDWRPFPVTAGSGEDLSIRKATRAGESCLEVQSPGGSPRVPDPIP